MTPERQVGSGHQYDHRMAAVVVWRTSHRYGRACTVTVADSPLSRSSRRALLCPPIGSSAHKHRTSRRSRRPERLGLRQPQLRKRSSSDTRHGDVRHVGADEPRAAPSSGMRPWSLERDTDAGRAFT